MSGVRDFMLEPGRPLLRLWRRDKEGDQWLPETPGIWRFKVPGFPWRLLYVWGDATNRLMCAIHDAAATARWSEVKSQRQLPANAEWQFERCLEPSDGLPMGLTVADYIARVEQGGAP